MNVKYNWIVRKSRSKLGACMFTGTNNDSISKWLQIPGKPAYWQTDWQIGWQRTDLLANWQIAGWQARWQTGWSAGKPTGWLTSWLQTGGETKVQWHNRNESIIIFQWHNRNESKKATTTTDATNATAITNNNNRCN